MWKYQRWQLRVCFKRLINKIHYVFFTYLYISVNNFKKITLKTKNTKKYTAILTNTIFAGKSSWYYIINHRMISNWVIRSCEKLHCVQTKLQTPSEKVTVQKERVPYETIRGFNVAKQQTERAIYGE